MFIIKLFQSVFIGLFVVTAFAACTNRDAHDHPNLKTGQALFNHHCAECHGEDGTGNLVAVTPANILTSRGREGVVDYVTKDINPDREMPVFSTMPYPEAALIANHLLKLRKIYDDTPNKMKKPRPLLIEP